MEALPMLNFRFSDTIHWRPVILLAACCAAVLAYLITLSDIVWRVQILCGGVKNFVYVADPASGVVTKAVTADVTFADATSYQFSALVELTEIHAAVADFRELFSWTALQPTNLNLYHVGNLESVQSINKMTSTEAADASACEDVDGEDQSRASANDIFGTDA